MLQRFLYKWGGESLGRRSPEWRALRTLFLVTASYEILPQYRHDKWYAVWDRDFPPSAAESISTIARIHSFGYPWIEANLKQQDVEIALQWYDLERYLAETVGPKFRRDHSIDAFDFFSIIIWKANRAKSHISRRLLRMHDPKTLPQIVDDLARALAEVTEDRDRMRTLFADYGFLLPTASAILTVLWPERFTDYDIRACDELGAFHELAAIGKFSDHLWTKYVEFREAVEQKVPGDLPLRDKDRVLCARSGMKQLHADIKRQFAKPAGSK